MTYLVDRDRIIEDVYLGYAVPVSSPFGPLSPQHDPNIKPREHDVEKALGLKTVTVMAFWKIKTVIRSNLN